MWRKIKIVTLHLIFPFFCLSTKQRVFRYKKPQVLLPVCRVEQT
jgi:hypothetical protein